MGLSLILKQQHMLSNQLFHQAEEKKQAFQSNRNVGFPANLLQVEPTQGMIPVTSDTKEITDQDVENVVNQL